MIKSLQSTSPNLTANYYSPPYISNNGQMAGQTRFNITSQNLEVYDGANWISMSQNVSLGLSSVAEEAIHWVQHKMQEESNIKELAEKHKSVAAALANLNKAQEQLRVVVHLSKEANETTS